MSPRLLIAFALLSGSVADAAPVRLTGDELAARGAVDLATALALIPELTVRADGRGGREVELRGARGAAIGVWLDGVRIAEPYDGGVDLAAIPITDVAAIEVDTAPTSALDGPGGAGGAIRVTTRDPVGAQLVIARLTADSAPGASVAGSARVPLGAGVGLRLSAAGQAGARDLDAGDGALGEQRRGATAAGQLAYRAGAHRLVVDGSLDDRHLVGPPIPGDAILLVDRETALRGAVRYEGGIGALRLEVRAWSQYFARRARFYAEPARVRELGAEDLKSLRSGAAASASRPFLGDLAWVGAITVDFAKAATSNLAGADAVERVTTLVPAAGLRYAHGAVRADVSAGVALPFGVGIDPWPELAANARLDAGPDLAVSASAAYTARAPTLREWFDGAVGNVALTPEQVTHVELRAALRRARFTVELAPYYRHLEDRIELRAVMRPLLVNLGKANEWGVDARATARAAAWLELGTAYSYVHAEAAPAGDEPLRGLPAHRWDGWLTARPAARLSVTGRVTSLGRARDGVDRIGRATVVELDAAAQLTPRTLLVLRGDDLLDARPEDPPGVPGPGRTLSLVVQSRWD